MSRTIRGNEFANRSADSKYPLHPAATGVDTTGAFTIPNDFLVGLYLSVPADSGFSPESFHVRQIIYTRARCSVVIGAVSGTTTLAVGQFDVIETQAAAQLLTYGYAFSTFTAADAYAEFTGRLMVGGLDSLKLQPQGVYQFTPITAGISVDCVRPKLRHISAFEVVNNSGQVFRLTGIVRLTGGTNANVRIAVEGGQRVVVFDAVDGSQLNDQMNCQQITSTTIKTVNGLPGNSDGEINLIGSRCLEIAPQQQGLQLTNGCSEPCASCEEAQALKSLVDPFVTQVPTLTSLINRIDIMVSQLQSNIAMSTSNACGTSDDPCEDAQVQAQNISRQASAFNWFRRNLL